MQNSAALPLYLTGQGLIGPAGLGAGPLWEKIKAKTIITNNGLGYVSQEDLEKLKSYVDSSSLLKERPRFFSKTLYFSLFSIINACEQARWNEFRSSDIILIGTTTGMLGTWESELIDFIEEGNNLEEMKVHNPKQGFGYFGDELARVLNFNGKIHFLSSACSASTQGFSEAIDFLRSGLYERALVGGVEELGVLTIQGFGSLKLLSENACTPFDKNRSGINLSEGAAFFTLEKNFNDQPLAKVLGGTTVLDSYHMTAPHPEAKGYVQSLLKTLEMSQVESDDISLIYAHGTGSFQNDSSESVGLYSLFKDKVPVISTKGVHGHSLGASGALEIGMALKIFEENIIPGITGLKERDEELNIQLPMDPFEKEIHNIIKTTLGFGGVNSCVLLQKVGQND